MTDPSATILSRLGAKSWTELYERTVAGPREGDLLQALLSEGLIRETDLRRRMICERVLQAKNRSEEIRRLSDELGLSPLTVRDYAYTASEGVAV